MPQILIKRGDTLSGLAKQYGTTISELMRLNPSIRDPNLIYAGASLTVPEKTTSASVALEIPTERERIEAGIAKTQEELRKATELLSKVQAYPYLKPTGQIPKWIEEAKTPEEVAALARTARTGELELKAFEMPAETPEMEAKRKATETKMAEISRAKEDYERGVEEIGENPWLSEAGRVGRTRRLAELYEKRLTRLAEEYRALGGEYEVMARRQEGQRSLYEAELKYLAAKGEEDKILTWSELENINAGLPADKRLPYGTTRSQVIRAGIVPSERIARSWTEFTDLEKRKLRAAGIDWRTPEGFMRAVDYLYLEEEIKITPEQYKAGLLADKTDGMPYETAVVVYGPYVSKDWIDWVYGTKTAKTGKEKAEELLYAEMNRWLEKAKAEPNKYVIKADGIYEVKRFWPDKKVFSFKK